MVRWRRGRSAEVAPEPTPAPQTPQQVLERLDFTVVRRLDGLMHGQYRSTVRGVGLDFTDVREYQPEDDSRHVDWNVTARMDEPFVRQFVEDRDLTAWFLLDRTASMGFGGDRTKAQQCSDATIALARLLSGRGNRVAALMWDGRTTSLIEPGSGTNHVLRLAKAVIDPAPTGSPRGTDLSRLAEAALAGIRRRSLIVAVSDFVSEPGWEKSFARLGRRHEVVALRIVDPAETALPNVGLMVVEDAETGDQLHIDTSDPGLRRRFEQAARDREERVATLALRARIDLHSIATDDDLVRALLHVVRVRSRRPR